MKKKTIENPEVVEIKEEIKTEIAEIKAIEAVIEDKKEELIKVELPVIKEAIKEEIKELKEEKIEIKEELKQTINELKEAIKSDPKKNDNSIFWILGIVTVLVIGFYIYKNYNDEKEARTI